MSNTQKYIELKELKPIKNTDGYNNPDWTDTLAVRKKDLLISLKEFKILEQRILDFSYINQLEE